MEKTDKMDIILASASPRRKALMDVLGIEYKVIKSDCDEIIDKNQTVPQIVMSLSLQKATDVLSKINYDAIIIGADTVVSYDGFILGKPKSKDDASNMLKTLSGKTHSVYTGYTILRTSDKKTVTDFEESLVTFKKLTDDEIFEYTKTSEPYDKAGSYSIQGTASSFVTKLVGDYNNVVGLPIYSLSKYLYNTFNIRNTQRR